MSPLLSVRGLEKHYPITEGILRREVGRVRAVDGVSFDVERGETLGIVGESGCGKSTLATTLLRLEEPTGGEVWFDGEEVTAYDDRELKRFRRHAQMIFQDPTASFDPRMSIGEAVGEPLYIHGIRDRERRRAIVADLLERVGLSAADADRYPHEFSGGQKQRIAVARALVLNPDLIVADEPTSSLDVSVQVEILDLLAEIQAAFGLAMVFISHDLGVIREICDRVAVMYLGEVVELAPTEALFESPAHPYTRALLAAIPAPDPRARHDAPGLQGDLPNPAAPPPGCRFHTRCPEVIGPEDATLEGPTVRAVLTLRRRIETGRLDLDALRTFLDPEDPDGVPDDRLAAAVREEYDVPARLPDPAAERVLEEALDDVVGGDPAAGAERLREGFESVCERRHPEFHAVGEGHRSACHLHEVSVAAEPGRADGGD